jgi:hypothetical protein
MFEKKGECLGSIALMIVVPRTVDADEFSKAGERYRVSTFVWRLPRIAAYYANARHCIDSFDAAELLDTFGPRAG